MSLFNPTPEEQKEDEKLMAMLAEDERWCEQHVYEKVAWGLTAVLALVLLGIVTKLVITH